MMHSKVVPNTETGNAVTLTLLGLSVAILAGVAMLYYIGRTTPQPIPLPEQEMIEDLESDTQTAEVDPRGGWRVYENETFNFTFMYPAGWIVATGTVHGSPAITVYESSQGSSTSTASVHDMQLRVTVYPLGVPVGGSGEAEVGSMTTITVPQASAHDRVLGTGRPWATTVRFDVYPSTWSESGFVFGRVPIKEEELGYFRGETGITAEEFDVYAGDEIRRFGFVDTQLWEQISQVLNSFSFTQSIQQATDTTLGDTDMIRVRTPQPGATIASPLLIEGEVHTSWYLGSDFPVRLETPDGEVLAAVPATVQTERISENYVPFEVALVFGSTTATTGYVILDREDTAVLIDEYDVHTIPVLFSE